MRLESLFGPGYRQRQQAIAERYRELGLAFQGPEVLSNSRAAIEAAEFARDAGRFGAFHRAVLAAYFARGLDIGDREVLREVGEETGLDGKALVEAIGSGWYADQRTAAEGEARRMGVTAVPTFALADGTRVVGAQPLEYFRRLLAGRAGDEAGK